MFKRKELNDFRNNSSVTRLCPNLSHSRMFKRKESNVVMTLLALKMIDVS